MSLRNMMLTYIQHSYLVDFRCKLNKTILYLKCRRDVMVIMIDKRVQGLKLRNVFKDGSLIYGSDSLLASNFPKGHL